MGPKLIVLAAGGTGGHVFPAEALASELLARGHRLALVTDKRGTQYGGTLGSLETHRIAAGGLAGRGLVARAKAVLELGLGTFQAIGLLGRLSPAAVVGFGGYASVPTLVAASRNRIPTLIHEQNAVLGRANRLLARRVSRIATCYPQVAFVKPDWTAKTVLTGLPVRPAIQDAVSPYQAPAEGGEIRILVMGGSQGARIFSEVLPDAISRLPEDFRARLRLSQQVRPEDYAGVKDAYDRMGLPVDLQSFFKDVPARLGAAHLLIARSGASTMGELTVMGRPAILVPYPHAIDDHQTANARALDAAGGAWLIPQTAFTAQALADRLQSLFALPASLDKAAACALAAAVPDAARRLADAVEALISSEVSQ